MRIDSTTAPTPITTTEPKTSQVATGKSTGTTEASVVKLSSAGVAASSVSEPDITAKLSHIRSLLEKGEYPVDLDQLASRIVDDEVVRGKR